MAGFRCSLVRALFWLWRLTLDEGFEEGEGGGEDFFSLVFVGAKGGYLYGMRHLSELRVIRALTTGYLRFYQRFAGGRWSWRWRWSGFDLACGPDEQFPARRVAARAAFGLAGLLAERHAGVLMSLPSLVSGTSVLRLLRLPQPDRSPASATYSYHYHHHYLRLHLYLYHHHSNTTTTTSSLS